MALGRPRHRWEDNIKMDLREIGIDGVNWSHLARDRVQCYFCEYSNEPLGSIKKAGYSLTSYQLSKEYPAPWSYTVSGRPRSY